MDFPNAQNRQEAYIQWIRVLTTIGEIDPTTTVHSLDKKHLLTHTNPLLDKRTSIEYTELKVH